MVDLKDTNAEVDGNHSNASWPPLGWTTSKFAPENGWFEDDCFFWGVILAYFQGLLMLVLGSVIWVGRFPFPVIVAKVQNISKNRSPALKK